MNEKKGVTENVRHTEEITDESVFYTIKGDEDYLCKDGYPVQVEESNMTYAKETGVRKVIKIDDRGKFINPMGLFQQTTKQERWMKVSPKVFKLYIDFLRTKKQAYLVNAEREAI